MFGVWLNPLWGKKWVVSTIYLPAAMLWMGVCLSFYLSLIRSEVVDSFTKQHHETSDNARNNCCGCFWKPYWYQFLLQLEQVFINYNWIFLDNVGIPINWNSSSLFAKLNLVTIWCPEKFRVKGKSCVLSSESSISKIIALGLILWNAKFFLVTNGIPHFARTIKTCKVNPH